MSDDPKMTALGGNAAKALKQFVDRYERLETEKKQISVDQKDVMAQAKSQGFDTKILRKVIARRKKEKHEIEEEDQLLELYEAAINEA